jgi:hypothetical protein
LKNKAAGIKYNQRYWTALTGSFIVAFLGFSAPSQQLPLNYRLMLYVSVPLAFAWAVVLILSISRYKRRGLWLLLGTPMALYWPIWLLFNNFPPCYYSGGCM